MSLKMIRKLKLAANTFVAAFLVVAVSTFNTSPAMAFAGTLENGNLAYAAGSGFDKGEACNYLPGFETGYDAWHFVLTSRGATFQQSPTNPAISINLNFVFMRQDGSLFVIKSGAWVQTGKGAYTYTRVEDKIRMVQAGTVAQINGLDSGMRLSHTCPGTGTAPAATTSPTPTPTATATASPSPTATATRTASPTPTATATASPSPTATRSASPTPSPTASASATPTPTPTPTPTASTSATPTPTPTPTPSSTVIPTLRPRPNPTASAVQIHPVGPRNPLPTPSPTQQSLTPTPTPTASPTPTSTQSTSPNPSNSPSASPSPSSPPTIEPTLPPPVVPTPPPVEDPKKVIYVDPQTPTTIDPKLPETPSAPLVITKEPELGKLQVNDNGTFTYTPPAVVPEEPAVEIFEFSYTDLAGKTVIVRREIVLTKKGDVPSIIQTGSEDNGNSLKLAWLVLFAAGIGLFTKRRKING